MRIESYNQVAQIYNTKQNEKTQAAAKKSSSDHLEISSMGKDYQTAKKAAAEAADIRAERVESIKNRMDNGLYQVSNEEIADKLLQQYGAGFSF